MTDAVVQLHTSTLSAETIILYYVQGVVPWYNLGTRYAAESQVAHCAATKPIKQHRVFDLKARNVTLTLS